MTQQHALYCVAPGDPPTFMYRSMESALRPGRLEVLVDVHASSVNPIDAKRAAGYGRRLLSIKGAARFPLALGNDFSGTVRAIGSGVDSLRVGDRVWGLKDTGPSGTHATSIVAPLKLVRKLPDTVDFPSAAVLPYTFTTLWHALLGCGLSPASAKGSQVLIAGASGGLGQLALQLLRTWGANTTAICSTPHVENCTRLGATQIHNRLLSPISALPSRFDAVLNFGSWQDDAALATRLQPFALGHATTVHPLMDNFDRLGCLRGARQCLADWKSVQQIVASKGSGARYVWTIFKPEPEALDALHALLSQGKIRLPIGVTVPLRDGAIAFEHVAGHAPGRAVLIHVNPNHGGETE